MVTLNDILEACNNLEEVLAVEGSDVEGAIRKHLGMVESKLAFTIPDFPEGLDWLNTTAPLSIKNDMCGKIVILDFFTYCCINCMHVLPDLEALEQKFSVEDGVVIIGVHSAKFENEKVLANIQSAVLRYNIHHPVVNDHNATLWAELQIACWPTFVVVGPSGQFLYQFVGEGHREKLLEFVRVAKDYYGEKGMLTHQSLPLKQEVAPSSPLSFPGKVCVSRDGLTVAVADTGHHRLLVLTHRGVVQHVIGSSERGYKDGSFQESQFSSPQGVVLDGQWLYIADTDNHVIRRADLANGTVETLAGTGCQGDDKEGGNVGTQQALSSPWDLCVADGSDGESNAVLYIAMAGTHQVWAYFIKDTSWFNKKQYTAGTCVRFAGSGLEENRNNSYPQKAGFAQPSGITISQKLNCLFIADSESSSVRSVNLQTGAVKNVVGGDIDPKNLFAYGDVDDTGTKAKLQHPFGVAMETEDGPLLVADSYNHKVKSVDIASRSCKTLLGSGQPGSSKGDNLLQREINEPGGLWVDQKSGRVYIADTNNHQILVLEIDSSDVYNLPVIFAAESDSFLGSQDQTDSVSDSSMAGTEQGRPVKLLINLAEGIHLNEEAPNSWKLFSEDADVQGTLQSACSKLKGDLSQDLQPTLTHLADTSGLSGSTELSLQLDLFVCEDSGCCRMDKQVLKQTIEGNEIVFKLKLA